MDHKDLGIHSEMFSDGVVPLVERGAVTNATKKVLPGRCVGSFVIGTEKVFEFIDQNPFVSKLLTLYSIYLLCVSCLQNLSEQDLTMKKHPLQAYFFGRRRKLKKYLFIFSVMLDVGFVNLVSIISQNPKVTAINSCIEVDLTGQVVSDSIGTRLYSGVSTLYLLIEPKLDIEERSGNVCTPD